MHSGVPRLSAPSSSEILCRLQRDGNLTQLAPTRPPVQAALPISHTVLRFLASSDGIRDRERSRRASRLPRHVLAHSSRVRVGWRQTSKRFPPPESGLTPD